MNYSNDTLEDSLSYDEVVQIAYILDSIKHISRAYWNPTIDTKIKQISDILNIKPPPTYWDLEFVLKYKIPSVIDTINENKTPYEYFLTATKPLDHISRLSGEVCILFSNKMYDYVKKFHPNLRKFDHVIIYHGGMFYQKPFDKFGCYYPDFMIKRSKWKRFVEYINNHVINKSKVKLVYIYDTIDCVYR